MHKRRWIMDLPRLTLLALGLAGFWIPNAHAQAAGRTPAATPMTPERAFILRNAVYDTLPGMVNSYGLLFDKERYNTVMRDEFQRPQYLTTMAARVAAHLQHPGFDQRYTMEGIARFGEYSATDGGFPLTSLPQQDICLFVVGWQCYGDNFSQLRITTFDSSHSINTHAGYFVLQMPEAVARQFIAERNTRRIPRSIAVRITYSVLPAPGAIVCADDYASCDAPQIRQFIFRTYTHGIAVIPDRRWPTLPLDSSLHITYHHRGDRPSNSFASFDSVMTAATRQGTVVGTYTQIVRYVDRNDDRPPEQVTGSVRLLTGGVEYSEVTYREPIGHSRSFYQLFGHPSREACIFRIEPTKEDGEAMHLRRNNYYGVKLGDIVLHFPSARERDRFYTDVLATSRQWVEAYPMVSDTFSVKPTLPARVPPYCGAWGEN